MKIKISLTMAFIISLFMIDFASSKNEMIFNNSTNNSYIPGDATIMSFPDYDTTISGTLVNYSHNYNGICGSISAAIVLQYYDTYLDDDILPIECEYNEIETLYTIMPYIDHVNNFSDPGGSDVIDMYDGLNDYLSDVDVNSNTFSYNTFNINTYKACINLNKPVIVDLDNHPIYHEHWVVGYGYYTNLRRVTHIICVDGWGNSYVQIPLSYIGYIVY